MKQVEKVKQDDALSDMSDILVELKEMAVDMGCEIDRLVSIFCIPEKLCVPVLASGKQKN